MRSSLDSARRDADSKPELEEDAEVGVPTMFGRMRMPITACDLVDSQLPGSSTVYVCSFEAERLRQVVAFLEIVGAKQIRSL